ncbi:MAG: 3'(2'),5'-bisphosphate nucleotidase [Ardenticatenaceae bacterium]
MKDAGQTTLDVGIEAVLSAARLTEAVRGAMVRGETADKLSKEDRSPVTVADFGAQALVCRRLSQSFPQARIVAEEDSVALRRDEHAAQLEAVVAFVGEQVRDASADSVCDWIDLGNGEPQGQYWVLDPIDGTKGFLRNDQYAIALALIVEGVVRYGFLACPVLPRAGGAGALFVAERGAGSKSYAMDGALLGPVRVSDIRSPADACLAESVESAHTNLGLSARLKDKLGIGGESVRMDSQAKYAAVARGQAEIYLRAPNPRTPDYRENIWDHAAGWLVVAEAGGQVTDVYGRALDWSHGRRLEQNVGVVATNGHLHNTILDALAPLLA